MMTMTTQKPTRNPQKQNQKAEASRTEGQVSVKITKDQEFDIGYIQLQEGKSKKTIEISPEIILDLDENGNLLGVELLSLASLDFVLKIIKKGEPKKNLIALKKNLG